MMEANLAAGHIRNTQVLGQIGQMGPKQADQSPGTHTNYQIGKVAKGPGIKPRPKPKTNQRSKQDQTKDQNQRSNQRPNQRPNQAKIHILLQRTPKKPARPTD